MDKTLVLKQNKEIAARLKPEAVFGYFAELCARPHCTGQETVISDYIEQFARRKGFACIRDALGNLIVSKPASPSMNGAPGFILQAHVDMVGETDDPDFNFETDPIELRLDGEKLYAAGTTLGADNGIAVAMILAILDDDSLQHPPLEAVFSVAEEVGQKGMQVMDLSPLKGKYFVNLDNETFGEFLVCCAGGVRVFLHRAAKKQPLPEKFACLSLEIGGLRGGHSGVDIHKGHINANKLMGRVLAELYKNVPFRISEYSGGMKNNAIPRSAKATAALPAQDIEKAQGLLKELSDVLHNELKHSEPNFQFKFNTCLAESAFDEALTKAAVQALYLMPNGLVAASEIFPGITETSQNLGVAYTREDGFYIEYYPRSAVNSRKYALRDQICAFADLLGFEDIRFESDCPAWEYNLAPAFEQYIKTVYRDAFGREAERSCVHGGVECCYIKNKRPELEAISIGPDICFPHSPVEHVFVESVEKCYHLLTELLANASKLQ